jgi:hypothetical protein
MVSGIAQPESLFNIEQQQVIKDEKKYVTDRASVVKSAKKLLNAVPFVQGYEPLITSYEYQELSIDRYIQLFDRTHTGCGSWGFSQLTKPITNYNVIIERQQSIVQFDNDQEIFYHFCRLLDQISHLEEHLLAYYNDREELNKKSEQLYYSLIPMLNESKLALDWSYGTEVFNAAGSLAATLCLNGLIAEFFLAQSQGRSIQFWQGFRGGFRQLFDSHMRSDKVYQDLNQDKKFDIPDMKETPCDIDGSLSSYAWKVWYWFADRGKHFISKISTPASVQVGTSGSFGDKWSYGSEQLCLGSLASFVVVTGQLIHQDQSFYARVKQSYKRLLFLFNTYAALQHRLVMIAQLVDAMTELINLAQRVPALEHHSAIKRAHALLHDDSASSLRSLLEQLQYPIYKEKTKFVYSRGQVLITHKLLKDIKMELVPLLQALGIIDGFISICRVYQEHKHNQQQTFCFADMVISDQPLCHLTDAWLPLIKDNHVYNSCSLGEQWPRNLLLSGPNGGGKSTFLKLIGGSVVLAQSWGIVPATQAKISLFHGLRTSFNPQEDLAKGISTFMAQQERLSSLERYIQKADQSNCYMLLVDEPYRGTIELEAERRSYHFAMRIANYCSCMLLMSSHLKKTLDLQEDTQLFKNMHLQIDTLDDGSFVRKFKLCDGAAHWWFEDIEKRIQFIDWLHYYHPQEVL